jgi:hypothetical protein
MFVRLSTWNNTAPTGRIFMKFDIWVFFDNLPRKSMLHWNRTGNMGTVYEDQYTFLTISRSVLLRMRNVSDKFAEKIKTHILCSVTCFPKSCRVWGNVERYCTGGHAIDENMAHAHFTLGTQGYKHTLSECVIILLLYCNNRHTNTPHCYVIVHCLSCVIYETCGGGGAMVWTTILPVYRDIKITHKSFRKLYALIHIFGENFMGQFADSLFRLWYEVCWS